MPVIPRDSLVVVEGRAPCSAALYLLHVLHGSLAAAEVAFYDPRWGVVAVANCIREWQVGQVVNVTVPAEG